MVSTFELFNIFLMGFLVTIILRLIVALKDGRLSRKEYHQILKFSLLMFLLYTVIFSMREYTQYLQINLFEDPIKIRTSPGTAIYTSFSTLDRVSSCYLVREGIDLEGKWYPSSEKIRQYCSLDYFCKTGSPPTSGTHVWACLRGENYIFSSILNFLNSGITWIIAFLLVSDVVLDSFGLFS